MALTLSLTCSLLHAQQRRLPLLLAGHSECIWVEDKGPFRAALAWYLRKSANTRQNVNIEIWQQLHP